MGQYDCCHSQAAVSPSVAVLFERGARVPICTQGLWAEEDSWWPAFVHAVLPKGYLKLRLESTAMHPEVTSSPTSSLDQQVYPWKCSLVHMLIP